MALIRKFSKLDSERYSLQGEVVAKYAAYELDGKGFVQINTYGSAHREMPGKVSQTIQLDRAAAEQLVSILKDAFRLN